MDEATPKCLAPATTDTATVANDIAVEIQDLLTRRLRDSLPYLKIESVQSLAAETGFRIEETVTRCHDQITASKARVSFFSLSAELRTRCYEHIFADTEYAWPTNKRGDVHYLDEDSRIAHNRNNGLPAILQTSQQVRAEASPLFYGLHTFVFTIPYARSEFRAIRKRGLRPLDNWLTAIGPKQARLISSLVLRLPGTYVEDLVDCVQEASSHTSYATVYDLNTKDVVETLKLEKLGVKGVAYIIEYESYDRSQTLVPLHSGYKLA